MANSDQKVAPAQYRKICPQSDLSGKALYIRPYEYLSHLIYTIKNQRIRLSACAE
jgi:hypothetical protein